jgi:g-D-glutamyl-meso-diaminopimelate peptidase
MKFSPEITHSVIGYSRLGRPIHALTLGSGTKSVLINASHHANEWITTLILMKFINEIADEKINVTLHCIPLVNPDGADLVTGGIGKLRIAYKEAEAMSHSISFPDGWKANICGVDLNSNYPSGWEIAKKNKFARGFDKPGPRDYVGPRPLSEPESCALAAYTVFHDIDITLSLHTQGEEIYWRYMNFNPPGAEELAQRFSLVSGYKLEEVPDESSHAGYRDWFIRTFSRPGFTIECGSGESPLPLSQFDDMYKKVSAILRETLV